MCSARTEPRKSSETKNVLIVNVKHLKIRADSSKRIINQPWDRNFKKIESIKEFLWSLNYSIFVFQTRPKLIRLISGPDFNLSRPEKSIFRTAKIVFKATETSLFFQNWSLRANYDFGAHFFKDCYQLFVCPFFKRTSFLLLRDKRPLDILFEKSNRNLKGFDWLKPTITFTNRLKSTKIVTNRRKLPKIEYSQVPNKRACTLNFRGSIFHDARSY